MRIINKDTLKDNSRYYIKCSSFKLDGRVEESCFNKEDLHYNILLNDTLLTFDTDSYAVFTYADDIYYFESLKATKNVTILFCLKNY